MTASPSDGLVPEVALRGGFLDLSDPTVAAHAHDPVHGPVGGAAKGLGDLRHRVSAVGEDLEDAAAHQRLLANDFAQLPVRRGGCAVGRVHAIASWSRPSIIAVIWVSV